MEGALGLVSTIGQLVGAEYSQLRGVTSQVAELRDELATMNALLRMQSEVDETTVDHFVREWMKQVRELAYDSEDCIHLYIFRIRCRQRDRFLAWSKRLLATLLPRRRLAGEIEALQARALAISDRHARYGVSREALSRSSPLVAPQLSAALSSGQAVRPANDDPVQLVGITEQAETLAKKLEKTEGVNDGSQKRKVLSIFGFGGLGKTTLAMEVCRQLDTVFQRQAQVSVSQAFDGRKDLQGLLQRVLQQIAKPKASNEEGIKQEDPLGSIDKMSLGELATKLKELLTNKRYLIVIDDVWTTSAWSSIISMLPENECHSRIIVTTRIQTVAKASCSDGDYLYQMEPLKEKKRLLSRWIAEGLVMEKRGLTQMEVAEACFDDLVSRGMITRCADIISYMHESKESCQVHDILLEVLVSKSLEANFASLAGGLYQGISYDRIRRLSVHGGGQEQQQGHNNNNKDSRGRKILAGRHGLGHGNNEEEIDVKHVRSLSMFDLGEHKLLERLGEFTLLRVLDLEGSKGLKNRHMEDICRMYLMRFLSLKGTDISVMPQEVGKLEHLQTLDVSETLLPGLPDSVTDLHQLERLLFTHKSEWFTMWKAPTGLSKMKALREASCVVIKDNIQAAQEIGDLEQLGGLFVYLDESSSNHAEVRRNLASSLSRTNSLRWLIVGDISDNLNTLDYLFELSSPPPLVEFLRFAGGFSKFPEWVGSLTHLVEFTISWGRLHGDQLFDVLSKAESLKTITLQAEFYDGLELVARTSQKFRVLKNLRVTSHTRFPEDFRFEQGSMPTLETLVVNFHYEDKSIDGIQHLTSLKEVQLKGSNNNSAIKHTLKRLKIQSDGPSKPNQFIVGVQYD
uniref:Uncharacterized protein n=1 Tax=Avena sativa TaxID=4498 RepID=A0ACD5YEJ8_AVESA